MKGARITDVYLVYDEQSQLNFGKRYEVWRKSGAVKALERELNLAMAGKNKDVPKYALPKQKREDKTANGLQRCIIDFLTIIEGWQAERINVMGRPIFGDDGKLQKWITGQGTKGSADISATINGWSVKIEVKIGTDRQRPEQKQYQADIEKAGGYYVIAKTFEGFLEWYSSIDWQRGKGGSGEQSK
ncbi:MAG: hypothetical protein MJZ20_12780 [Bacteroidaceae bacterium]|nr:hypothetical protein [Bacteroidaceae bacterium]